MVPAEVDIIVAGGGPAGCATAGRLAAIRTFKSCWLKPGHRTTRVSLDPSVYRPGVYVKNMQRIPENNKAKFYEDTMESSYLRGRKSIVPCANILGGGTSINPHCVFRLSLFSPFSDWTPLPSFLSRPRSSRTRVASRKPVKENIKYTKEDLQAIDDWCADHVETTWHSLGTCAMKPRDKGGVVDAKLNVYGTKGLKIADLSICPENFGTNTYSSALLCGEKGAQIIADELDLSIKVPHVPESARI
ncbi:hypothetical protein JCM6882_004418 [Rhodosporidiobolus microsporus]